MGKVWVESSYRAGQLCTGAAGLGRAPGLRSPSQLTAVSTEWAPRPAPLHKAAGTLQREGCSVWTCKLIIFKTREGRGNLFYRGCGKGPNTVLLKRNVIQDT